MCVQKRKKTVAECYSYGKKPKGGKESQLSKKSSSVRDSDGEVNKENFWFFSRGVANSFLPNNRVGFSKRLGLNNRVESK